MSLNIPFDRILDYSDHERRKWRKWIDADPKRLDIPMQPGGRFATLGLLLEHLYFVERRHLSRLEGGTPPDATGVATGDWEALFEYGELVRADLRRYAADLDDAIGNEIFGFSIRGEDFSVPRRQLMVHILLHEVRHLAQMALAARLAGVDPPGDHDILFCPEA